MKPSNYFEGTLQLRKCGKEVTSFVEDQLTKNNVGVASKTKSRNGHDYKVSSNTFLVKLKGMLRKKFNGRCIMTKKLFTRHKQTGKNVYRLTLLFEELPFKVGDIIMDRGDSVKVMRISDKITVRDEKTRKTYFLNS